ncbi:hypothetical protein ABH935_008681 [Catenulispora sp. GAS73]
MPPRTARRLASAAAIKLVTRAENRPLPEVF